MLESQSNPNWTEVAAIAAVTSILVSGVINVAGWFVNHRLTIQRENLRDQRAKEEAAATQKKAAAKAKEEAEETEKRRRDEQSADWRRGFREIVLGLKVEMARAQIPSDWYGKFEVTIPILNRVAVRMPETINQEKREAIAAFVHELTIMSDSQVVQNAQGVFQMLSELEELTK